MTIVPVDPNTPDPAVIADGAARLCAGQLVAFPTETVYGLGADALDPDAVARIFAAKGRPAWNPVIVHVADVAAARALARDWPATAATLAAAFWPGPLTLVVAKAAVVPDITTAGRDAVAIRVPDHPVARALIRAAGRPIAAPSANRFTQVSPTTADDVWRSLAGRVDMILDAGSCRVGIESTVVDCTGSDVVVLRPGMINIAQLATALDRAGVPATVRRTTAPAVAHDAAVPSDAPRGPGMADRHYAPRAEVWLVDASQPEDVRRAVASAAAMGGRTDGRVRALWRTLRDEAPGLDVLRMPDAPDAYARTLYRALHEADAAGMTLLLVEQPPTDDPVWDGIRDRLTRASR